MKSVFKISYSISKWFFTLLLLSIVVGSTSALFLFLLQTVTIFRETHLWIMLFLPLAGIFIVWLYNRYAGRSQKGNNLILEEYYRPREAIPFRMAPLIVFTTLITHLFGGSAGREGTAVQYGATFADQFTNLFRFSKTERRILLMSGIAAGFASLFGTPWAGALFGLELVRVGKIRWKGIAPIITVAHLSNYICGLYGHLHTVYPQVGIAPTFSWVSIAWMMLASIIFGITSILFSLSIEGCTALFNKIKLQWLRPFIGGIIILLCVYILGSTKHIGLGIPTILDAFQQQLPSYDFFIKIALTALTLSAGFKGGEVTPLFFIGATLGNALCLFIPLPMAFMVASGFIAVFAGCTKTPLACSVMGMELFGVEAALWFFIACAVSYVLSGKFGIYNSQISKKARFSAQLKRHILPPNF